MTDTEGLLAQIAGLQRQVADLQQQVVQLTTVEPNNAEPRFGVALNTIYDAPVTGYLSVPSTDGRTGRVKLFVGYEDPPTEFVGIASTTGAPTPTSERSFARGSSSSSTQGVSSPRFDACSPPSSDELSCATRKAAL
ncbi:MAG: hypothetical protein ACXVGO_11670 [Mycobacterium sp.]